MSDLLKSAEDWVAGDPDPATAGELEELIATSNLEAIKDAMGGVLEFGTAGIRGVVGPGSNRMNRAVVIRTTRGVADFLRERHAGPPDGPVIVGFDARPSSRQFAEDTVGVLAAAGIEVVYFPDYAPTPLVAFAARVMSAAAAVVVTASHNPPADNGYKVYDDNAAQIIPPADVAISKAIESVGAANNVPRIESAFTTGHHLIRPIDPDITSRYWVDIDSNRPKRPSTTVRIAYTPLHGVGGKTVAGVFDRTSHNDFHAVAAQFEPDGRFPTVKFPNPEEPGAMDMAMELGDDIGAELILANDPDADRLAAAVRFSGRWRLLTGNELGVLLGSYILDNWAADGTPITANSVVSSPMLGQLAASAGAVHLTTLTGFKWIANAAMSSEQAGDGIFAFGYEEALGFSIGRTVRDKDGISAALMLADIAALEREHNRSLMDALAELWGRTGIWVSSQKSLIREGTEGERQILDAVDSLASTPPDSVGKFEVTKMTDFRANAGSRPSWLGAQALVELELGDNGRVLARPSGTEPKLKVYVDLREGVTTIDAVHEQRDKLLTVALEVADDLAGTISRLMA